VGKVAAFDVRGVRADHRPLALDSGVPKDQTLELGPLTTIAEIEDGLRITAKLMGAEGDLVSASRNMAVLASQEVVAGHGSRPPILGGRRC
jgi:hypothetical protein